MRINHYRFPEDVPAHVRAQNGAEVIENTCTIAPARWNTLDNPHVGCPHKNGDYGCLACSNLICIDAGYTVDGCSVSRAKQLLNSFGGTAWTDHCERDGGCFEVTQISLSGNNSRFKYNRHL